MNTHKNIYSWVPVVQRSVCSQDILLSYDEKTPPSNTLTFTITSANNNNNNMEKIYIFFITCLFCTKILGYKNNL